MSTAPSPGNLPTGPTARAAVFHAPGRRFDLATATVPVPAGAEVLVRVTCCALCSSDLHTHSGRRSEPTPTVLGHEIVGVVAALGPDHTRLDARGVPLSPGDRITWTVAAACGTCPNCADGLTQKCHRLVKYGHERLTPGRTFTGGLAEVILLAPGTGIVMLPPEDVLPTDVAVLANCSTATVAAVLRTGFARRHRPGMSVAVLGAGVLGLTACAMSRAVFGATTVLASDISPSREAPARSFGATHFALPADLAGIAQSATRGLGFDVVVELAGEHSTCQTALSLARMGGTVVLGGATRPTDPLVVEPQTIIRKLLRIEGVHNYVAADLVDAVDFLAGPAKAFPFGTLIATRFPLTDIDGAFDAGHHHPGTRVLVLPGSHINP